MTEPRTVPKQSLARLFPNGFPEFWAKTEMKPRLESVVYDLVPATLTAEETRKTLMSGYGMNAVFIAKHYFLKYQYRTFEPYEDDFMAQFTAELTFVIAEIRRTEWLWQDVFRNIKQWLKPLKLTTDTRTSQNYDKTQTQGGRTTTQGNENQNWSDQKQSNQKNTPTFSNVDLSSGTYGGFSRQQQLSTQTQEQGQGNRNSNRKNTTDKINHVNKEHHRSKKDENVSTVKQDVYELNSLSRLLNNFALTILDFSKYYPRFNRLFIKMFGVSVVPVIDPVTGRRKYITEAQYEEEMTEETGTTKPPEGNEWDETIPYLERLKILHTKTEKEWKKLPDTSNRKPRIALRLKNLEGCLKAYEPEYIELPTVEVFRTRIRGEEEGYQKVIGYQNIIQIVEKYLRSYHFAKRNNTPPPAQLMIMLLGEPGLGKTYISQAIARALGRGLHIIGMNGKLNASLITGTNIENPGAEPGEVLKAISRYEDRACVIVFDEIEKAARECKEAAGIPTDITGNKNYRDTFLDFPTPTNECIFISTVNRPEDVPSFVADRFAIRVEVLPLGYLERLEVVRVVLQSELKKLNNAFQRIYGKNWQEIYHLFNQEELLKKTLTWTFSIRGAKNNILLKLIPTLISDFLEPESPLTEDPINYDWDFLQREGKDENCPYAKDIRNNHKVNCMCFVKNLNLAPGWAENMGGEYHG
ncbi:AAA family ATPase [endosymbiont GvMRE of Glomus versiforme]|uniref:AAA family ATPase n=1 Tax=endosymbiont GvMRE of Glomus versiforme TaxID=2039283 RepID=UPI000EDF0D9C|nr:ATP-binding protein [endosymbiont GvMRE of Glomus versiforme]RHZ37445.1 ATP-dependent protease La [endosymbiont GvMRE of Glomus versiforme]RHZ37680.1 ATP-dependent protease La [endosymbiont GvMRE of Glomus versiforme]RHZ37774.1 ATP-dependent protease La [endosymbiont GvMRE of Glomus versiforme]